jgi:hypothetical protein
MAQWSSNETKNNGEKTTIEPEEGADRDDEELALEDNRISLEA